MDNLKHDMRTHGVKSREGSYFTDPAHMEIHLANQTRSAKFWKKVKKYQPLFGMIPFVKLVAVGNTLAINGVGDNSDIDLFIVARQGRVWTARMFLLLWLSVLRSRVQSTKKYMKFSPEFFVDETAMDLSQFAIASDYYLNFWVADLVPVWGSEYFTKFWKSNRWLRESLPIAFRSPNIRPEFSRSPKHTGARMTELVLGSGLGDTIEKWARTQQQKIITKNLGRIGVNPSVITDHNVIKLHFNDRRGEIRDKLESALV